MGSTRLPGKVLKPVGRLPLLGHVVGRLAMLRHPYRAIVATSTGTGDDAIAAWCDTQKVTCFRGSESDVLARYYGAAQFHRLDPVIRLTADNPFTDMEELDRLIDLHHTQGSDFTHSFAALPVGVGAEIFSFGALERSAREGHAPHHREHVDEYMIENPQLFKTAALAVSGPKNRPDIRLTVDTDEDYRRACLIAEQAAGPWATTEEAIALCLRSA
jgi:spore coat polysaccharide biosynthesis protein SpsF